MVIGHRPESTGAHHNPIHCTCVSKSVVTVGGAQILALPKIDHEGKPHFLHMVGATVDGGVSARVMFNTDYNKFQLLSLTQGSKDMLTFGMPMPEGTWLSLEMTANAGKHAEIRMYAEIG